MQENSEQSKGQQDQKPVETVEADDYLKDQTRIAFKHLGGLDDKELVGLMPEGKASRVPIEMARRLRQSIDSFKASADKSANKLLFLTWVLVGLTVVLAVLTGVLLASGHHDQSVTCTAMIGGRVSCS